MKTHTLRILPEYFEAVKDGRKTFEIRLNDRGYNVGDSLVLQEFASGLYSGDQIIVNVTDVLFSGFGLEDGWVIMSIRRPY
jgi:ASC-1-like (ASCH) protein